MFVRILLSGLHTNRFANADTHYLEQAGRAVLLATEACFRQDQPDYNLGALVPLGQGSQTM